MRDRQAPARFGVVVYDGVEPIDLGGTVGVVSMATRVLPAVEAVVIAARPGPVQLAGGLAVTAAFGFADAPACDRIIVCGGATWPTQAKDADMLAFLRHQSPGTLASVCTGAMILAAAGLLDGHAATTRRHRVGTETISPLEVMASLAPKALPTAALIVDDVVVTGGGVSLAIDTTLYLLGSVFGTQAQQEVAAVIEYDRAYEANRSALGVRGRRISQFTTEPAATSDIDTDKVDEAVLALLHLTLHDGGRAWKGHDWESLGRLHRKGLIENPAGRAKSVALTEVGLAVSKRSFHKLFGKADR